MVTELQRHWSMWLHIVNWMDIKDEASGINIQKIKHFYGRLTQNCLGQLFKLFVGYVSRSLFRTLQLENCDGTKNVCNYGTITLEEQCDECL